MTVLRSSGTSGPLCTFSGAALNSHSHTHTNIFTPSLEKNADFGAELEWNRIVHVVPCEFISVVTYCKFLEEQVPAILAHKQQSRWSHSASLGKIAQKELWNYTGTSFALLLTKIRTESDLSGTLHLRCMSSAGLSSCALRAHQHRLARTSFSLKFIWYSSFAEGRCFHFIVCVQTWGQSVPSVIHRLQGQNGKKYI